MRDTLEEKIAKASSLFDVLMIMKEKTMLDTHVATLAYIEEEIENDDTKSYAIWRCKPFPLYHNQSAYSIQAYSFKERNYSDGDIVLIVFTDLNFIASLNSVDTSQKQTQDNLLHSMKYGIVISI